MARKLRVVPLPDLVGKRVLDVGCDHGFWCFLAAERGAKYVLGIDRNRPVKGKPVDLVARNTALGVPACEFAEMALGLQWHEFGDFDVVLMLSMYHHAYNLVGEHDPIWFWLSRHAVGEVLWENPVDVTDGVARKDIRQELHGGYTEAAIRAAAEQYFDIEVVGPGHVPSRVVWRCTPKALTPRMMQARVMSGAHGASKAFEYANGRRIEEIRAALGVEPVPGSLNLRTFAPFWWDHDHYVADVADVVDRRRGLSSAWAPRRCRFYPLKVNGAAAYAMRFDGERYGDDFVEVISDIRLRETGWLEDADVVTLT